MCSDGDERICAQGLHSALGLAIERYRLPPERVLEALEDLFELAGGRARSLAPPFALAVSDLCDESGAVAELGRQLAPRLRSFEDEKVRVVWAATALRNAAKHFETTVTAAEARYAGVGALKAP